LPSYAHVHVPERQAADITTAVDVTLVQAEYRTAKQVVRSFRVGEHVLGTAGADAARSRIGVTRIALVVRPDEHSSFTGLTLDVKVALAKKLPLLSASPNDCSLVFLVKMAKGKPLPAEKIGANVQPPSTRPTMPCCPLWTGGW
jgi:hypothetical protein